MAEVNDCRQYWWINLLYISNYVKSDHCFRQSWYISADFQLFFLGMAVYVLTAGVRRRLLLAILFIIGSLLPAAITFSQDLDGMLLFKPENIRTICEDDPTMHSVYIKAHTNLPCYVAGLALGLLVFHLQKTGYQAPRTGVVRFLYWLTLPFGVLIGYFGSFLYEGDTSLLYRTLYAGLVKPLWALNGAFFIFGMVNQFEVRRRERSRRCLLRGGVRRTLRARDRERRLYDVLADDEAKDLSDELDVDRSSLEIRFLFLVEYCGYKKETVHTNRASVVTSEMLYSRIL